MPRSKFATRLTLVVLSALTLAACSSEVPDTHPDQRVTKRKQAFKAMLRSFEPMGVMLRTHGYRADEFARVMVLEMGKPFVFLGSVRPGENSTWRSDDVVWTEADNVQGCKEVVQHLIELGHRRIGCITGSERHVATHNRLQGYKAALNEAGIALDHGLIEAADFTEEGGYLAAKRLLERRPDVTAIFASNDQMAFGALHAARERGLHVPRDLSVAGFDGIATLRYSTPQLTTAQQPIYELGQAAARLLIEQVQGRELAERHALFPCRLRVGDTTGPPRR